MIEVTVRLLPGGDPEAAQLLGRAILVDEGDSLLEPHYSGAVFQGDMRGAGGERRATFRLDAFRRRRGVWALVAEMLRAVGAQLDPAEDERDCRGGGEASSRPATRSCASGRGVGARQDGGGGSAPSTSPRRDTSPATDPEAVSAASGAFRGGQG